MLKIARGDSAANSGMEEMPEALNPSVIAGIYRKVIQLREELAAVADQFSKSDLHADDYHMKAAVTSMGDAIANLKESRAMISSSQPLPKRPINPPPLTASERAVIFQNWERKRKSSEQQSPHMQRQKASKSQQ